MQQHPLAAVLESNDRTAAWLARRTGFSPSYVTRVLNGERKASLKFREQASKLLSVPEDLLFPKDA